MKNTTILTTANGIELITKININYCNKKPIAGSDFDIDSARQRGKAYAMDVIGSFSPIIIALLKRRMQACMENLTCHLNDIEYADEAGHICWTRKDGSAGNFNVGSFTAMKECIENLRHSRYKFVVSNRLWIDQILKAILNDTEHDHSDQGGFKWSTLISILMELHLQPIMD